ncbi:unnamed protein product [Litomosoides sigmodontis]|uniref:Uncharacterized protein n=1 Tax=Litomosoides sigmodontis TaxID=42156 RepID=A0A3P6TXT4_LITSI|nr:unnamed protein product [Litomosoides sigmodontis]
MRRFVHYYDVLRIVKMSKVNMVTFFFGNSKRLVQHFLEIATEQVNPVIPRFGAVQLPGQYAFIYLVLQRMERFLPEFCAQTDQYEFPACLTFSETFDDENSKRESGNDHELPRNDRVDLFCSNF